MDPFRWSISALYSLQECGYLWRLQYGELRAWADDKETGKPEFAFGKAIHRSIEHIHREGEWEPSQWMRTWDTLWREEAQTVVWSDFPGRFKNSDKLGPELLSAYTAIEENRKANVLASEKRLEGEIGGLPVVGVVDQIRWTDRGIELIDFKTSKEEPGELEIRTDPQLTMYAHLCRQNYGTWPRVVMQYYLRSGNRLETVRHEDDVLALGQMIREAEERVRRDYLVRQLGYHCRHCSFKKVCLEGLIGNEAQ